MKEISEAFVEAANLFEDQDVLYGFSSKSEAKKSWEKGLGEEFESDEEFICTVEYNGKVYDPIEDKIWDSAELLEKHQRFIEINKDKNR